MKKYSLEKFKERKENKKMAIITVITIIALIILILVALYLANKNFRSFIDRYILRKEVFEKDANTITIDTENLSLIYAYDKFLATYTEGNVKIYNSNAKNVANIEITLSKPIAASEKAYLALGDYGAQKICLIKDTSLLWQKDIEGKISKISVNKEGYVVVSVTGTTYESIVMVYDTKGKLLFSQYLSTDVISVDISEDHKYIAVAEIDNSKITPSTKIEIISTELAISEPEKASVNSYEAETNEYLSGMNFQNKNNLICCFDKYVMNITEKDKKRVYEVSDLSAYLDANMSENFARVDKEASSVFKSDYRLKVSDNDGKEKVYIIEGNLKNLKTKENIIALDLGNEIEFISKNARLIKRYVGSQDINDVVMSEKIGVMIYKSKIDIIRF